MASQNKWGGMGDKNNDRVTIGAVGFSSLPLGVDEGVGRQLYILTFAIHLYDHFGFNCPSGTYS